MKAVVRTINSLCGNRQVARSKPFVFWESTFASVSSTTSMLNGFDSMMLALPPSVNMAPGSPVI